MDQYEQKLTDIEKGFDKMYTTLIEMKESYVAWQRRKDALLEELKNVRVRFPAGITPLHGFSGIIESQQRIFSEAGASAYGLMLVTYENLVRAVAKLAQEQEDPALEAIIEQQECRLKDLGLRFEPILN